jgi:regulator of sigma E protease
MPLDDPARLSQTVNGSGGNPVRLDVDRPGRGRMSIAVQPRWTAPPGDDRPRWLVGIVPQGSFDLAGGVREASAQYGDLVTGTVSGFHDLISGAIPGGLGGPCGPSGPVGIVRATGEAASAGLVPLLFFAAFLSLNLGILNLLPIPALDGGRLLFLAVEAVRGRPLDPLKEQRVHYVGLVVLIGLIVLISFNDVLRLPTPFQSLVDRCSP